MSAPTYTSRRRLAAVAVAASALLGQLLTGTATAAVPAATTSSIAWVPCESPSGEGEFECGTLTVPVDWQHPDGTTVDLALARHRATDPDRRIGSLLLNPGGPGQSGVNLALSAPFSFSPNWPPVSTSWASTRAVSAAARRCAATRRWWTPGGPR